MRLSTPQAPYKETSSWWQLCSPLLQELRTNHCQGILPSAAARAQTAFTQHEGAEAQPSNLSGDQNRT